MLLLKPVCNYNPMCVLSQKGLITTAPLVPVPKSLIREVPVFRVGLSPAAPRVFWLGRDNR